MSLFTRHWCEIHSTWVILLYWWSTQIIFEIFRYEWRSKILTDLWAFLIDLEEEFKLFTFLDGWNKSKVLQVTFKIFHSFFNLHRCSIWLPSMIQMWLSKLERSFRELEWRELVEKTIMQAAKSLITLCHFPSLTTVEIDFNNIICVRSLVFIFNHMCVHNC